MKREFFIAQQMNGEKGYGETQVRSTTQCLHETDAMSSVCDKGGLRRSHTTPQHGTFLEPRRRKKCPMQDHHAPTAKGELKTISTPGNAI